jgi:transcriptional regulator with GAF, ATPase, and Fis domain
MRKSHRARPAAEATSAIETIAFQTRQRLALQSWNAITVAVLAIYAGATSLTEQSSPVTWAFVGGGLVICGAVMVQGRRARRTQGSRLLLGAWLLAFIWLAIRHGPLGIPILSGIIPILAAGGTLSPSAALAAGGSFAACEIALISLSAARIGPLGIHAHQLLDAGLAVAYPGLLTITGVTSWLLTRASEQAVDQLSALAHSWEQGQQTLENRAIERSRRVQEANRQLARHAKQIEVSAAIARLCAKGIPVDELLQESARLLQSQLELSHVLVYVLSPNQKHLVVKAGHGAAGRALIEQTPGSPLGEGSTASRAFEAREPVISVGGEKETEPALRSYLPSAESWAAIPLVCCGTSVGVIELYSEQVNPFDGAVLAVVETVATQLTFAMAGGREPSSVGLELDPSFAAQLEELSTAVSHHDVGRALVDIVSSSPAVLARLLLIERNAANVEWIVMRESWARDERPAEPVGTRLRLDDYPWAPFLSPVKPVIIEDIQADQRATEAALIAARVAGVRSMISIPLIAEAGWLGTWLVGRPEPSAFEAPLVRRYLALAQMAAVRLDNIQLQRTVRRQRQHEWLRAAVARPLAAPFETQELLQNTVQAVGRILGVPRVAVHFGIGREEPYGD